MVALGGFQEGGISMNEAGLPIWVFRVGVHAPLICATNRPLPFCSRFFLAAENLLLENTRFPIIRMARDIFFDLRIWRTSEISSHKRISFSSIRLDELGSVRSSWSVRICWFLRYLFDRLIILMYRR